MKILLLNDNPVVTKLVTLSAQKTSDDLEVVGTIDDIESSVYDLLVVDDTSYSDELFSELSTKIEFTKSLYICSRDAEPVEEFSSTLKKPFLPTDLVELFSLLGREAETVDLSEDKPENDEPEEDMLEKEFENLAEDESEELEELEEHDELEELEELEEHDDLELDGEDISLDEESAFEEELSLDDLDEGDDEIEELGELEELGESVLDDEEAQKVNDLLEETDEELPELDELEDLELEKISEETPEEIPEELEEIKKIEEAEEDDLESQIQTAVEDLSEEELESEVDEETLLDIVSNDMDSLDALTSRDLKLAIGEEVSDEEDLVEELNDEVSQEVVTDEEEDEEVEENFHSGDGVEALKTLLEALSDKKVAASLKGMKININITLGDN